MDWLLASSLSLKEGGGLKPSPLSMAAWEKRRRRRGGGGEGGCGRMNMAEEEEEGRRDLWYDGQTILFSKHVSGMTPYDSAVCNKAHYSVMNMVSYIHGSPSPFSVNVLAVACLCQHSTVWNHWMFSVLSVCLQDHSSFFSYTYAIIYIYFYIFFTLHTHSLLCILHTLHTHVCFLQPERARQTPCQFPCRTFHSSCDAGCSIRSNNSCGGTWGGNAIG